MRYLLSLPGQLIVNIFAIIFSVLIFHQNVQAGIEDGIKAIEKEDFMTAYQIFKNLAEQGDAEAQHNLAILYKQGKGILQDDKLAIKWFKKAADQGLADAQYYLGHYYDSGDGVEKDSKLAFDWYNKAAQNGNPLAQSNLGVMYANGEGTKQDIVLAYVWFSLAASQGLAAGLENRNVLAKDMSETMKQNAQKLTREYFQRYVGPFQPKTGPRNTGSRHPSLPLAHEAEGKTSGKRQPDNPHGQGSGNPH